MPNLKGLLPNRPSEILQMIKRTLKIFLSVLITYLCIELVCIAFMHFKFRASPRPSFTWHWKYAQYDFPFAEINPIWGMWHYPGHRVEEKSCFKVDYYCNSYGARDVEREQKTDSNRVVVLGDSFMEGYGIQAADRLSNQLEKLTGTPVLNFACGYFTPTQELLVYENLAKKFSHNKIIIGILPFNDLNEDDSSFHEQDGFIHYRPFLEGNFPNYQLIYREDSISKSTFNKSGYEAIQNRPAARWRRFLKANTYWYNLYHYIRAIHARPAQPRSYSGYFDFTKPELEKLNYILGRLKQAAGHREIYVLTLPVKQDFARTKDGNSPLRQRMQLICENLGIHYIDLLYEMNKTNHTPDSLFLECDGHWNQNANKLAAQIIVPLLSKQ